MECNVIDGNTGAKSFITKSGTTSTHGPFILEFGIPSSSIGNTLSKIRFKWDNECTGTLNAAFGYRRSSTNYSLNVSSTSNLGKSNANLEINTGTLNFNTAANIILKWRKKMIMRLLLLIVHIVLKVEILYCLNGYLVILNLN